MTSPHHPDPAALGVLLARERAGAHALRDAIAGLGSAAARRLAAEERFHTWGFVELLLETARQSVLVEPRTAEEQIRLALALAEHLNPAVYGSGPVEALQARAWAWLGNALRILSDFRSAERAFESAWGHLAQSWLDPLDEALLLELQGSLRRAQRRFEEALDLLDGAIVLYRETSEPHLQGRILITRGLTLQDSGDLAGAAACFRDSLFLLDGLRDARLVVAGQFNLINCMFDSGRMNEAAALIPDARRLLEKVGRGSDLFHLRWLEARVLAAQGRTGEAEDAFLETRAGFTDDQAAFAAALVSLDLAALHLRDGQSARAQRLAREVIPIFRSCEVPQEALAALLVLQKATEMEQLSLGLVEEVATVLQRTRGGHQGGNP